MVRNVLLGGALLALAFAPGTTSAQAPTDRDLAGLVAAQQAQPDRAQPKRAVEASVTGGLPVQLSPTLLPNLPVDATPSPDGLGTLITPKPFLPVHVLEPQGGLPFVKIAYLYTPAPDGTLRQFCQVHYSVSDDAPLAVRLARLLSLAHRTLVRQTGRAPAHGDTPFHVWLVRGGQAGGEQWGENLYFYDLDAPRSSIEWIREIVHEYSHLALPAIGGYKDPEYWANGYLGERVIVRWFQRIPDGPGLVQRAWGDFSGAANFDRLLITPALDLYRKTGPSPQWLARTDGDGMRYLIGQALAVDDKYGSKALGTALSLLPHAREPRGADWGAAVAEATTHRGAAGRS